MFSVKGSLDYREFCLERCHCTSSVHMYTRAHAEAFRMVIHKSPVLAWNLVSHVRSLYTELLESSQPKHIRQFAAESFAYLVRKVSQYL